MKLSLYILLLFTFFVTSAQNRNSFIHDNDYIKLTDNSRFIGKDTLVINTFENGKIHSKGKYAIDRDGKISTLKVGFWQQYFRNGKLESDGNYEIISYVDCGVGGLERTFYNYKAGKWNYYNLDSEIEATGVYQEIKCHLNTRCDGGTELIFMKPTIDWKILDEKNVDLQNRINSVLFIFSFDTTLSMVYDEKLNEMFISKQWC
jgi:hypothetical protein